MAGDHLIAARLTGNDDHRLQNAEFFDTVHQIHHVLIVFHVERMALKGVNFRDLQRGDDLRLPFVGEGQFEVLRDLCLIRLIFRGLLSGRSGGLILGGGVRRDQLAGNGEGLIRMAGAAVIRRLLQRHIIDICPDLQHTGLLNGLHPVETVYQLILTILPLAENDRLLQPLRFYALDHGGVICLGLVLHIRPRQVMNFRQGNEAVLSRLI